MDDMAGDWMMTERSFAAQLAADLSAEDVRHVLRVFRADLARLGEVLATAEQAGDAVAFRRAAHGLAGAAGAVGAAGLERACRAGMAEAARDAATLPGALGAIRAESAAAADALDAFLSELNAKG